MSARYVMSIVLATALLAGCSILNKPDEGLIQTDGGMMIDARPPDTGVDGGDLDGGVDACRARPEICDNEVDDDCDGLVDCGDYECADRERCCTGGTDTTPAWTSSAWQAFPSSAGTSPGRSGTSLQDFRAIGPMGLVTMRCVPMALGLELKVTMTVSATAGMCPVNGDPSSCYAQVVITGALDSEAGTSILRDFAVGLRGDGSFEILRGDQVIARRDTIVPPDTQIDIRIVLGPGLDGNEPAMVATTILSVAGGPDEEFAPGAFVVSLDDLDSELAPCDRTPGLFVAAQGEGSRIQVTPVTFGSRECVNPNVFRIPDASEGDSRLVSSDTPDTGEVSLGVGDWCAGGLGAPAALASYTTATVPSGTRWDVFVDGTNADRALYPTNSIGFALGHAQADPEAWNGAWITSPDLPKLGICQPSCLSGVPGDMCAVDPVDACDMPPHYREPSIHADVDAMGRIQVLKVAYSEEIDPDNQVFGIRAGTLEGMEPMADFPMSNKPPVIGFTELESYECRSARDPALVAKGGRSANGFWLFFTCEKDGQPSEIHVVELSAGFLVVEDTQREVLLPTQAAPYGSGGVRAPEVLVEYQGEWPSAALFRMWFTARRTGVSTIALAQGQTTAEEAVATPGGLPAFEPYPANPVIEAGSEILRSGCAGSCPLTGVAVARDPSSGDNALRFLVARSVQGGTGGNYELVPLTQFWRSPWDGS